MRLLKTLLLLLVFMVPIATELKAQMDQQMIWNTMHLRMGATFIRVAEAGELADTVSIWGDITYAGNYVVPRGTTAAQLMSYARGPARTITQETVLDWSQLRIEVNLSHLEPKGDKYLEQYVFKFNEALPRGLRETVLQNHDVIIVEVKRKPAFVDWVRVIAPVVSTVLTTVILFDRFVNR